VGLDVLGVGPGNAETGETDFNEKSNPEKLKQITALEGRLARRGREKEEQGKQEEQYSIGREGRRIAEDVQRLRQRGGCCTNTL
jgi:predicted transcriptional regulator